MKVYRNYETQSYIYETRETLIKTGFHINRFHYTTIMKDPMGQWCSF